MPIDWHEVEARYRDGCSIPTVAGGKTLQITGADDQGIHIRNALWKDTLRRKDLERAVELIEDKRLSKTTGPFVEEYRTLVADVRATSVAHVLKDLGWLE
jgi:dTDP-glucose pyrophosphorylase